MSTIAILNATYYKDLHALRNAIVDFCQNAETAQSIIGQVYKLTEVIEKENNLPLLKDFELRYSCLEHDIECLDIHVLSTPQGKSLGYFRLHYRDCNLTPLSAAEEAQSEQLPVGKPGLKLKNISVHRMRKMVENSIPLLTTSAAKFASTIVSAFMESTFGEITQGNSNVSFQLDIHKNKKQLTLHSFVNNKFVYSVSLPLAWFDKHQAVSKVQGTEDHDYLFEPHSALECV